jgi:hypothetical protein
MTIAKALDTFCHPNDRRRDLYLRWSAARGIDADELYDILAAIDCGIVPPATFTDLDHLADILGIRRRA